ncbi:MAG: peptide/nickel transport system ATP-binding protein [Granulosicoccus sp.]|jgi:peptide/nickel transport system ATP-binding protein
MSSLLEVKDLTVSIPSRFGEFKAVDGANFHVEPGEIHGLVGESGAGKSTIGAAIMGLLEHPAIIEKGSIRLLGDELTSLDEKQYHQLRGNRISMIFQDPQTSLNPLLTIADQLIETIQQHRDLDDRAARTLAINLLGETGIEHAEQRLDEYPHQFSGGMRQRVVIAMALCTNPELIIADEPTTALDVSIQKQILSLIRTLAKQHQVGVILITHDIGVIAEITDKVTVLKNGKIIETGTTPQVLGHPIEDYTKALMAAVPRLDRREERFLNIVNDDKSIGGESSWHIEGASAELAATWLLQGNKEQRSSRTASATANPRILEIKDLSVTFGEKNGWFIKRPGFKALNNVSLQIQRGEVLGLVGESGSGKSTLAKALVGLVPISSGSMEFNDASLPDATKRQRTHPARREIQMVFQDPYSSLNNRRTVEAILTEPLQFYGLAKKGIENRRLVASVLNLVEMPQRAMLKYPHQFSGGQRQRIAVARALMAQPSFLICDEPTSALDVSIQAQILNLLKDLQSNFGLTILFISHNLAVVRQMADQVLVLRRGEQVEKAASETFFNSPGTEYSQQLLRETPSLALLTAS